jgi:transcriptional regulator with XRE-family HTH domain
LETLRHIREQVGLSQPELSELSGVAQGTISDIELGKRKPRGRTLRKLAQALGVQVADLLGESENLKVQAPLPDFEVERREAASDVALDAARHQREHNRKAINRTLASQDIPQPPYFEEYENAAIQRLSGYLPAELVPAVMEVAQIVVQLEERVVQLEEQLERTSKASSEETKTRSASA